MADKSSWSSGAPSPDLHDLSPSEKLVAKTLEYEGDTTQSGLAESTHLPARTVRYALTQLEESGFVRSRTALMDARQQIYSVDRRRRQLHQTVGEDRFPGRLN